MCWWVCGYGVFFFWTWLIEDSVEHFVPALWFLIWLRYDRQVYKCWWDSRRVRVRLWENSTDYFASAIWLEEPGRWAAIMSKLLRAEMKNKQRNRAVASGSLLVPELMIVTTASLSQWHKTPLPFHACPHIAAAWNIGSSSFCCDTYYRKRSVLTTGTGTNGYSSMHCSPMNPMHLKWG